MVTRGKAAGPPEDRIWALTEGEHNEVLRQRTIFFSPAKITVKCMEQNLGFTKSSL